MEELRLAIANLSGVLSDCNTQIEALEEDGDLGDMWDTLDLGNWEAMKDLIEKVMSEAEKAGLSVRGEE
jgi:hypothetical protein